MQEVRIKTHLITTDIHSEFHINWCGKIAEANPYFNKEGLPIFIIISSAGRMEIPTVDMKYLEKCAKRFTYPKGRGAVSTDESKIYIKEKDNIYNFKMFVDNTWKYIKLKKVQITYWMR